MKPSKLILKWSVCWKGICELWIYLAGSHYNFTASSANFGQLLSLFITENCLFCDTSSRHRQQQSIFTKLTNLNFVQWFCKIEKVCHSRKFVWQLLGLRLTVKLFSPIINIFIIGTIIIIILIITRTNIIILMVADGGSPMGTTADSLAAPWITITT